MWVKKDQKQINELMENKIKEYSKISKHELIFIPFASLFFSFFISFIFLPNKISVAFNFNSYNSFLMVYIVSFLFLNVLLFFIFEFQKISFTKKSKIEKVKYVEKNLKKLTKMICLKCNSLYEKKTEKCKKCNNKLEESYLYEWK